MKVSKIESVTVYGRAFKTQGVIPHHASLTMTYEGTVLAGRWISFVDATLNSNNPCGLGAIAAAPLDSAHSGSMATGASTKTFTANTAYSTFQMDYGEHVSSFTFLTDMLDRKRERDAEKKLIQV